MCQVGFEVWICYELLCIGFEMEKEKNEFYQKDLVLKKEKNEFYQKNLVLKKEKNEFYQKDLTLKKERNEFVKRIWF